MAPHAITFDLDDRLDLSADLFDLADLTHLDQAAYRRFDRLWLGDLPATPGTREPSAVCPIAFYPVD